MNRTLALIMLNLTMSTTSVFGADFQLRKRTISADSSGKLVHKLAQPETWKAERTAVILCDVWDYHHSINAVRRLEEMLPRMNDLLKEARGRGATIIHAPSDCMPAYEKHAARLRALGAPKVNLPKDIAAWCSRIPSEESSHLFPYPIDQSDGGEDDDPEEHRQWAAKLESLGRNPGMPWKAQSPGIEIDADKDYISDRGDEVWSILKDRNIEHVVLLGVHTNMCVLGRPFGLRQMAGQNVDVVLVRDLTDCMYNPKRWPYVDHFTGNDLVVSYVERFVCPTITSDQILSGQPLCFAGDKRTMRDVISITENKPNEWQVHNLAIASVISSIGSASTASLRCAIRFPDGALDEPATLSVQSQVRGAWLNGKPLEVKVADNGVKEFRITKDLTFGNDDANLLVLQIDLSNLAIKSLTAPRIKSNLGSKELNGNWEVKSDCDESARNIPLPAKFGMRPEVFYTLP
jgi:nicotinamidase-related amidase